MKLNASLLSGHAATPERSYAQKLASRLEPGQRFRLVGGGSGLVLQTTTSSDGLRLRVATAEGQKTYSARQFASLDVVSPAMHRLASFVHRVLAYEAVIDDYVKEAIKHAGLPVDPTMNWASYLNSLYNPLLMGLTKDQSIKEDAIRDLIVHELYEKRILSPDSPYAHFNPEHAALAGKELDKKVSAFLITVFKSRRKEIIDNVKRTLGIGSGGSLGLSPAVGMELERADEENENSLADVKQDKRKSIKDQTDFEGNNEVQEFLTGFKEHINATQRNSSAKVLNIITDSFAEGMSRKEIRDVILSDESLKAMFKGKLDLDAYNYLLGKWGQMVRAFAKDPANGYSNSPIGRMIADMAVGETPKRRPAMVSSLHIADMEDEGEVPAKGQPMPNQPNQPVTPPPTSAIPPAPPATNPNVQQQQDSKDKNDDAAAAAANAPKITIPPEIPGIHTGNYTAKDKTMTKKMSPEDRAKIAAKAKEKAAKPAKRAAKKRTPVNHAAKRAGVDPYEYTPSGRKLWAGEWVVKNSRNGQVVSGHLPSKEAAEAWLEKRAREMGKSVYEYHVDKVAGKHTAKPITAANKYAAIRFIAEKEAEDVDAALSELADSLNGMSITLENLKENLDLVEVPKEGTIREKIAARNRYAAGFRRLAEEAPEQLEDALNDFYSQLDDVVTGVEHLADGLQVELVEPEKEEVEEEVTEEPMPVMAKRKRANHIGWGVVGQPDPGIIVNGPDGPAIDVSGYNESDYWDGGKFKGPDQHGITPIYRDQKGKQFPAGAKPYAHMARKQAMPYTRKTKDEYQIQQNWGQGWEEVCSEDTWAEAKQRLKEYRENQPEAPVRCVKKRIGAEPVPTEGKMASAKR